jgi:hypothetical protein
MGVNLNRSKPWGASRPAGVVFLLVLAFLAVPPVFAQDFGLVLNQRLELTDGEKSYGALEYAGTAIPWFDMPLGDRADLYLSGGISALYTGDEWKPLPEIHRCELAYSPAPGLRFEAGRLPYRGSPYAMTGLFDGASFRLNAGGGRLSGGVFYTGLLYKKSALIMMTREDRTKYAGKDEYFASRRLVAGINWGRTGIFDTRNTLSLSGAAQFDLNGKDTRFHSQYLEAQAGIPLGGSVNIECGGVIELAEETEKSLCAAFAGSAEIQWMLPTAPQDRLSCTGWFSSGRWNDQAGEFIPLTTRARGKVLRPESSGIALVEAAYTVRLHPTFASELSGAYYFRTDTVTFYHPGIDPLSNSPLMGLEVHGGLTWAPFSDLIISAAGGVFLPRTGRVFADNSDPVYRFSLSAGISL